MSANAEAAADGGRSRLWAIAPLALLLAIVLAFSAYGESITALLGRPPPPADEFDVRRVTDQTSQVTFRSAIRTVGGSATIEDWARGQAENCAQ